MSQYGMNMPGGQGRRVAMMNVYTGLLFVAVLSLATACVFLYVAGAKVGKNGNPFDIQDSKSIQLGR